MAHCVVCGCSDNDACIGLGGARCTWSEISEDGRFGVCSFCDDGSDQLFPQVEDRRIIVPGDPDFHL